MIKVSGLVEKSRIRSRVVLEAFEMQVVPTYPELFARYVYRASPTPCRFMHRCILLGDNDNVKKTPTFIFFRSAADARRMRGTRELTRLVGGLRD